MILGAVKSSWALFAGLVLIMLGNGLQGSLLGLRAVSEGFSTGATGIIMSGYFAGFLLGSAMVPRQVSRVGHIRVFAALASLASTVVLAHSIILDPLIWTLMRFITGFCYAGLYVIAESWLNDRATNETRGGLLAIYMVAVFAGMGGGQFLLNLADPGSFELFILSSVLISVAVVPILLTALPAPDYEAPDKVGLLELYFISPLGVVGSVLTGAAQATLVGMGAVYAGSVGLAVSSVALFMGLAIIGGIVFQWPLGRLSDRFDRRNIIAIVTFGAALVALVAAFIPTTYLTAHFVLITLFGGLCFPMYSLCLSHTHDHLEPRQRVGGAGTFYIFVGLGSSLGPVMTATVMSTTAPVAFFVFLAILHGGIGLFALYRMTRRPSVPLEDQGPTVPATASATSLASALSTEATFYEEDEELEDGELEDGELEGEPEDGDYEDEGEPEARPLPVTSRS